MKTSIKRCFGALICAAILFIAAFSLLPILVQAETEAEKAIQKAEAETAKAEADAKAAGEAQKAADDAAKKAGTGPTPEDKAADKAADEADKAAEAADKAQDEAQKQQLEAEDAAKDAKEAGGSNEEKNKKAADEKKEAEDAAKAAKTAEDEAAAKEKAADAADKAAKDADNKNVKDGDLNKKKETARTKRKQRRAQRRRAAQAIRDARRLLHEATRTGRGSETESRKKRLDALEERLKGLVKIEEDARKSDGPPQPGKDGPPKNYLPPGADPTPESKSANGLKSVTFAVPQGRVTVNLPDDMMAGDTISGTVIAEPKGNTEEERNANRDVLDGYVVEISGQKFPVKQGSVGPFVIPPLQPGGSRMPPTPPPPDSFLDVFFGVDPPNGPTTTRARIQLVSFYPGPPTHPSGAIITPDPKITQPTHPSGAIITPDPKITQPTHPSGAIITPDPKITQPTPPSGDIVIPGGTFGSKPHDVDMIPDFNIPRLGQQGRPIVIPGPFDGNSSNTSVNWTVRSGSPAFDKPTGSVPRNLGLIAESPRKAIFQSPTDVAGPMEVTVTEGAKQTTGQFRNVGVNLSAPKRSLLKGESTELKVQVSGLEGLKEPVPLTIESHGVITMTGGNYQPLTIQPSEVGADGTYSTTRGITGVQAGGWGATATVVTGPFNVCLQDESRAATVILWNTVSGDYAFRPPGDSTAPTTGGAPTLGKGTMVMKGCVLTLQHNAPDRRVFATLDTCTSAGSAAVEMPASKVKFTITDRNIADNTCGSGP